MPNYLITFEAQAVEGQDDTLNTWFDDVHIADVLAVPGFLACQRYRSVEPDRPTRYFTTYEIEGDPQEILATLYAAADDMVISPALDPSVRGITIVELIGERRTKA